VDDHVSLRQMMARILAHDQYEIVGEAGGGLEALRVCRKVAHDVVILDLMLPDLCGLEVLRRLRAESQERRVMVYSGTLNQVLIIEALRLRPCGFVDKGDSLETFRECLRAVSAGRVYLSRLASALLADVRSAEECLSLTPREQEILQLVAESSSSKQIASRLGIALKTVENHRAKLMDKLRMHDVAALTRYAVQTGLVSVDCAQSPDRAWTNLAGR
jgi:DNA-binding NarL/FixJ family response regulator